MKLGDKTKQVYSGEILTECEYICDLGRGRMLFYDTFFKCFRSVFLRYYEGKIIMDGWECAPTPSQLI